MARVLVTYYSRGGNTHRLAEMLAEALRDEGLEVVLKPVSEVKVEELTDYDGIAIGSPTYYGQMAAEVKKLIDDSVALHGKLDGKVGLAFTTAGGHGTGGETTLLSILESLLIHGMVVQGDPEDLHYGLIVRGRPRAEDLDKVKRKAKRMAQLIRRLKVS
ncbi:flavodoxin family protein [Candidatus Bathyarchaeota archaeon]|nr:NAD(P)H-dependent oxidoreductase [Candidatus Bathyarchaeota archaeon]RJS74135.1 MAG: flavodoxin family protein [Candidatus Bathyarchaeota archaeon]